MTLRVEVVEDDVWASRVASRFEQFVQPQTRLCLATGNTVEPVYGAITDLAGATLFLLDEFGGLPEGDPGRCETMIRRQLTDHLTAEANVHAPDVDDPDPAAAAERYRTMISDGIDLAVVGLGLNGHVGLNEPGTEEKARTRVVDLHPETSEGAIRYGASRAPRWGITVGFAELMAAGEIWLLVTGRHKRAILERALSGPVGPSLPASHLRRHHNAWLIADRSAFGEGEPPGRVGDEHAIA